MRRLILLAGTRETEKALKNQLASVFGDLIHIESHASDHGIPHYFENELIVLSSSLIEKEVESYIDFSSCTVIRSTRTINYEFIDRIFELKRGEKVLYVNDLLETSKEAITKLNKLGINHVDYIPYSSESTQKPDGVHIAISPGETHLIPSWIEKQIDVGVRLIDLNTIIKIANHFELSEELSIDITDRYTKKIIELSQKLSDTHMQARRLNKFLNRVVDGVNDGILAIQENGEITVFNEALEQMLGMSGSYAEGKKLSKVFKNIELTRFLLSEKAESQSFFTLRQREVMVYRFRMEQEGVIVATFKDMEETLEMEKARKQELQRRGYVAKYTFSSILGQSAIMEDTKRIARKLANSELPILIHGETGTGKELFASAIHNESSRRKNPYLAINCGALPEELLESELFGYEEGSFTGAKKGGKKGVFEQADSGTLFLDEIGDISLKLQARLLRVLQEMEVRRIGDTKNISVDVRIVTATNKNLPELVEKGLFREDLYHRIKVLSLELPSLRERTEDIPLLAESFILQEAGYKKSFHPDVLERLLNAEWKGNVRELKNTILYMLALSEASELKVEDMPKMDGYSPSPVQKGVPSSPFTPKNRKEYGELLQAMKILHERNENASRLKLVDTLKETATPLTPQQIRTRMEDLQRVGFVKIHRGRKGSELTDAGMQWLASHRSE